jgi:SNF2 family DNA or RNA helicase
MPSQPLQQPIAQVASLWCLLTKGIHAGQGPTCKRPLVLCPSSLVQNWGKEFGRWLGDRVAPVVVDDTKAAAVKDALQVRGRHTPPALQSLSRPAGA